MNQSERKVIAAVLGLIALFVAVDLVTDSREGVLWWHVLTEGSIGLFALVGIFYALRGKFELRHRLEKEIHDFSKYKLEAETWRSESKKYVEGLSRAIDQQLTKWNLTTAEKEVAFLLLKGMSLKEVAAIRNTSEKTARAQSVAIYAKSGMAGRSELSAFFLEDLLVPVDQGFDKNNTSSR